MKQFRSRANGTHFPITPRIKSVNQHTNFSPQQLLNEYFLKNKKTDKLKLKKAAVSQMNLYKNQKNEDYAKWKEVVVSIKTEENRFLIDNTLIKIPKKELCPNVKLVDEDYDYFFRSSGTHGRYDLENNTLLLRKDIALKPRVIVHENGHYVYTKVLTEKQRDQWQKIVKEKTPQIINDAVIHNDDRAEEYFAELYVDKIGEKSILITKFAPPEAQKFMENYGS